MRLFYEFFYKNKYSVSLLVLLSFSYSSLFSMNSHDSIPLSNKEDKTEAPAHRLSSIDIQNNDGDTPLHKLRWCWLIMLIQMW